ncbi:MAG: IPTL-CTERM sorting domain-containing protein, partial [Phycisphaerae bacterium]
LPGAFLCECNEGFEGDGFNCQAIAACGDGNVDPGEECDDGNTIDGDGCQGNCMNPVCGDGIVDPGEACDGANSDSCNGLPCMQDCTCEEKITQVPTVSTWGLVILGLMLAIAAKIGRRRESMA